MKVTWGLTALILQCLTFESLSRLFELLRMPADFKLFLCGRSFNVGHTQRSCDRVNEASRDSHAHFLGERRWVIYKMKDRVPQWTTARKPEKHRKAWERGDIARVTIFGVRSGIVIYSSGSTSRKFVSVPLHAQKALLDKFNEKPLKIM